MELISIKPCDNTFFRDGHTFDKGINNYIRSKNVPYPSVFFGAIFTALLCENEQFRISFFNNNLYDHENILNIGQVYLLKQSKRYAKVYLPTPKDLFMDKKGNMRLGQFKSVKENQTSLPFDVILETPTNKNYERVKEKFMNVDDFFDGYASRKSRRIELLDESCIFKKNPKIGIGIGLGSKNVNEGQLYRIEETEFCDNEWSYLVEYSLCHQYITEQYKNIEIQPLKKGFLKLGGENKVAKYSSIHNEKVLQFRHNKIEKKPMNSIMKIVLTTDLFFEKEVQEIFQEGRLNEQVKLIAIANDKPIYIGGYNMRSKKNGGKGQPRKMYKGYGAGTVFLLQIEALEDVREEIYEYIENELISPKDTELGQYIRARGFGKYIILEAKLHE